MNFLISWSRHTLILMDILKMNVNYQNTIVRLLGILPFVYVHHEASRYCNMKSAWPTHRWKFDSMWLKRAWQHLLWGTARDSLLRAKICGLRQNQSIKNMKSQVFPGISTGECVLSRLKTRPKPRIQGLVPCSCPTWRAGGSESQTWPTSSGSQGCSPSETGSNHLQPFL